jgi:hypothetical protein
VASRNGTKADFEGFESQFMAKLKDAVVLFFPEIIELGAKHGLSEAQVEGILDHAEKAGLGLRFDGFVYMEADEHG